MRPTLLFSLLLVLAAVPTAAQRCGSALADAEAQYRSGAFDSAIARLDPCLTGAQLSPEERRQAFRLIGLSYIGKDREAEARDAVRALLDVAPDYRPDPDLDPPPYVALVEDVRRSRPRPARAAGAARVASTAPGLSVALRAAGSAYTDSGTDLSGGGGDLALGYGVSPTLGLQLRLGGAALGDGFSTGSASLGARYLVGGGRRALVPYVGVGVVLQTLAYTENNVSVTASGPGGEGEAGVLYFVSPSLALSGGVTVQAASFSVGGGSFTGTTAYVGVGLHLQP